MAKKKNRRLNTGLYIAVALVILLVAAFLGRGWIRKSLVPGLATITYGHSVRSTLDKEYSALQKPFDTLGIGPAKKESKCVLVQAKHFHMTISCATRYSAYSDKVSALQPNLTTRSLNLSDKLGQNGWAGGNTNLQTLGKNIDNGIDWTPDAAYMKTVGKTICLADFNTAYSKPKPAALAGQVGCERALELF